MAISSITTNYGNRTKDIHIFQGVNPLVQVSSINPAFGKVSQFCSGVQKLVQKYAIMLLTDLGSQLNSPTFGTTLMRRLRSGNNISKPDFINIFNLANSTVIGAFREYQRGVSNIPDDEFLDTAVLQDVVVTNGNVRLRIKLYHYHLMSESVETTQQRIEAIIKETNPSVDLGPGSVLSELLTKLCATAQNPIKNDIDAVNTSNSVVSALNSIEDTFNPVIDGVASNYNTTRNQGSKSAGIIKVYVAANRSYYVIENLSFYQPAINLNYLTTNRFDVKANPTTSEELQLFTEGGLYYFLLPVEAETVGANYQVSDQAVFTLTKPDSLSGFVSAQAYGNFTTGLPLEADKELIARFQESLTNKLLLTNKAISARLRDFYPTFQDVSIIGANAPEMTRAKHNIFGISTLGMADVYVRTALGAETKTVTKTATLINNKWTIVLDHDDIAGFYRIISITPKAVNIAGSISFTTEYSFNNTAFSPSNSLTTITEARFTKYQICTVTFEYPSQGTSLDVNVTAMHQPQIKEIQDLFLASDERIACADYLVRAAIPCYVTVALTIHKRTSLSVIPLDTLKQDIFNYINKLKFGDTVKVSEIVQICHNYDIKRVELPIVITGDIYAPDSTITAISSRDELIIPTVVAKGISKDTTIFISDYFRSSGSSASNLPTLTDAISIKVI
jgi:hypothetical protein